MIFNLRKLKHIDNAPQLQKYIIKKPSHKIILNIEAMQHTKMKKR